MTIRLAAALAAAALAAAPALAQQPAPQSAPADDQKAPSATAAGADASVTVGMPVKDKTGATIGSVARVATDAQGMTTATISMGGETFALDVAKLAVEDGSVTVNATAAEIRQMMKR